MIVYRIAKTKYIHDLTGLGARLYGGRWNHKGTGVLYTSETRALATVEYLVHVPSAIIPSDLSIASIEIPDHIIPGEILVSDLPANWRDYPAPIELANLGTNWATSNDTLLLRIPSVVVEQEFNILVNPMHPDMRQAAVSKIEDYTFDSRLVK